jgi:hypothetical protein
MSSTAFARCAPGIVKRTSRKAGNRERQSFRRFIHCQPRNRQGFFQRSLSDQEIRDTDQKKQHKNASPHG